MFLWFEYLGYVEFFFMEVGSFECVRIVNKIVDENWKQYVVEEVIDMKGYLLFYFI